MRAWRVSLVAFLAPLPRHYASALADAAKAPMTPIAETSAVSTGNLPRLIRMILAS
jgi:hypothetical protein